MCVKVFCAGGGVVHVLGGFEDGSVVLWDCRRGSSELAALKLYSEPGTMCFTCTISLTVVIHVVAAIA